MEPITIFHYHTYYQTAIESQYFCLSGCRAVSAAPMVSCSRTGRLNLTYKTSCAINNVTVYPALMDMCSKTRIYVYYVCVPPPPTVPGLRGIQRQELRLIKSIKRYVVAGRPAVRQRFDYVLKELWKY